MPTLNAQVKRIAGLAGTGDVSPWEDEFITSIQEQTNNGDNTTSLTEKQITVVERLFRKHYGDAS